MSLTKQITLIALQFLLILNFSNGFTYQKFFKNSEICGTLNGHRRYLELGETGDIMAHNISVPNYLQEVSKKFNQSLTLQCSIELVTCPSCIIKVSFEYMNFPTSCSNTKNGVGMCRCDYLIISEPPYDDKQNNIIYNCGNINKYESRTRTLQLKFIYWNNFTDAFKINYSVEENRQIITQSSLQTKESSESFEFHNEQIYEITSPFFPSFYPRDYITEHIIKCSDDVLLCRIRIEFSDFLISRSSSIEFIDSNGERLYVSGNIFRPPFLSSSGPIITVRFSANGGSDLGYKAKIQFITANDNDEDDENNTDVRINTNCGGIVDSVGGVITMMNMLGKNSNDTTPIYMDCIWIIKPPPTYEMMTHLSIKVEKFESMAADSEISIHQGITSDKPLLDVVKSSPYYAVSSRNYVVPFTTGLYVHFRGQFNSESRLALVYTSFSYSSE
ncbi:hypothetical protein PVAND_007736 [Polypedilum vanderplanki]|uniref:CUB domain-containing protein n=1 Tax=Polypedilum vanderplanki TaxID=319348 RepID=A0A9J6C7W0_POLVA|nr:hypothetical protein PVAND_007736 [Polypedilum vanderplanki]